MAPAKRTEAETQALREALLDSAARLIRREGAAALTMRSLATEAGCAVGLPYKLYAHRDALITDLLERRFRALCVALHGVVAHAGDHTIEDNLASFAATLLGEDAEIIRLAGEFPSDAEEVLRAAETSGFAHALEATVRDYVVAEQFAGRIRGDIDAEAVGFLVTGAVHNLVSAGPLYPVPTTPELHQHLASFAKLLRD
jgi:AcrR family transcriptional regulator